MFLFARPSLIEGMSRVLDIAGRTNEYNYSLTPEQADRLALYRDWQLIGQDMLNAMNLETQKMHG
jgi:hypothetical protein